MLYSFSNVFVCHDAEPHSKTGSIYTLGILVAFPVARIFMLLLNLMAYNSIMVPFRPKITTEPNRKSHTPVKINHQHAAPVIRSRETAYGI